MKLLLYIFTVLTLLSGCNKKWKKTSETDFDIEFITTNSTENYIKVESGYLNITDFVLAGVRRRGDDFHFSEINKAPHVVSIGDQITSSEFVYDIPQGEYTEMEVTIRYDVDNSGKSLVVQALFTDSLEEETRVVFEFDDRIDVNVFAESVDDEFITVIAKEKGKAKITLDIVNWFDHIPYSLFYSADRTASGGDDIILINKVNNPTLYALIFSRIEDSTTIQFE